MFWKYTPEWKRCERPGCPNVFVTNPIKKVNRHFVREYTNFRARKYCSPECYKLMEKQRAKERRQAKKLETKTTTPKSNKSTTATEKK